MDGALEISSVISDHDSHHITYNESEKKWAVRADFVNTHYAEAPAPLLIKNP